MPIIALPPQNIMMINLVSYFAVSTRGTDAQHLAPSDGEQSSLDVWSLAARRLGSVIGHSLTLRDPLPIAQSSCRHPYRYTAYCLLGYSTYYHNGITILGKYNLPGCIFYRMMHTIAIIKIGSACWWSPTRLPVIIVVLWICRRVMSDWPCWLCRLMTWLQTAFLPMVRG